MKLSKKVEYGLRAMVELAKHVEGEPVSRQKVVESQDIPRKYLEQIFFLLARHGLVQSTLGVRGGYSLAKPADKITAFDVYRCLDTTGDPIDCPGGPCEHKDTCASRELWSELVESMRNTLQSYTLEQLAKREIRLEKKAASRAAPSIW